MPIYEYRCSECGFEQEYLRKVSDAPLTECPECKRPTFQKKLTAAGFQLKGTGWYATDFRDSGKPAKTKPGEKGASDKSAADSSASAAADKSAGESKASGEGNNSGTSQSSSDSKASSDAKPSGNSTDKSAAA